MCGICGQLRFDGDTPSSESLDNMMNKLALPEEGQIQMESGLRVRLVLDISD